MIRPLLAPLLLVVLTLASVGCEGPAFLASAFTGDKKKVDAVFTLEDRPTLIVVDDPDRRLGSTTLAGVASANTAFHLKRNDVLTSRIVPERDVSNLAAQLGSEFYKIPIDDLGRRLGAEQVIYASVDSVTLQAAPTLYRPLAVVQVKVIDAAEGRRLFPPPPPIAEPGAPSRGRTIQVELRPKGVNTESQGTDAMMARQLAERVGLEIAQLFYEHEQQTTWEKQ